MTKYFWDFYVQQIGILLLFADTKQLTTCSSISTQPRFPQFTYCLIIRKTLLINWLTNYLTYFLGWNCTERQEGVDGWIDDGEHRPVAQENKCPRTTWNPTSIRRLTTYSLWFQLLFTIPPQSVMRARAQLTTYIVNSRCPGILLLNGGEVLILNLLWGN